MVGVPFQELISAIEDEGADLMDMGQKVFYSLKGGKTMAKKEKRMCKWSEKDLDEKFDKFTAIVTNPKFVCKKCLRVADKKKWLHKPAPLK
jgi:hypothetical protein